MKISEHANYLLNEYGRLQFDYAAYCKPYGESLRNEARNNLEEYIAELEAAQRWIPVSERLPEHGDFVLAWDNEIIEVLKYIRTFGGEWFIDIADAAVYPTHWMPLPQPPEVQE